MVKAITAYLGADGQVYKSLEEAEFADYTAGLASDIRDFLQQEKIEDPAGTVAAAIRKWDLWKLGGYAGWLADRQAERGVLEPAPTPAPQPELDWDEPLEVQAVEVTPAPTAAPTEAPSVTPWPVAERRLHPREEPSAPVLKKPPHRRRVAVVGLPNPQHRHIEKAFGDAFRLALYSAHDGLEKLESLRGYFRVVLMGHGAAPKAKEVLKRVGVDPVIVPNSMEALHDKLTEIWVQAEEAA